MVQTRMVGHPPSGPEVADRSSQGLWLWRAFTGGWMPDIDVCCSGHACLATLLAGERCLFSVLVMKGGFPL
jgi:hypothetical protein